MPYSKEIKKVTWIGLIANLCLAAIKISLGLLANSQVVVADGVHSLSDLVTDLAILIGIRYWTKPADSCHPYGHEKIETLVTTIIGIILALAATGILWTAITTLGEKHTTAPGAIAIIAVIISIIVKEALYRWTVRVGNRIRSMPLIANAWHHRTDALSSIPALITVGVATINPKWAFLDHVGAIIVSLFIFQAAYKIIYPSISKLLDKGAGTEKLKQIREIALGVEGVLGVHGIRTRYTSSTNLQVDLHIEVDKDMTVMQGHDISGIVKSKLIEEGPSVIDVVVHLEPHI